MNGKKAKRIRKHSGVIIVDWLRSLLSEEEEQGVTVDNYKNFMPEQTHYMAQRTMHLNAYHPKWVCNKITKIIKSNPHRVIETITLGEVQ